MVVSLIGSTWMTHCPVAAAPVDEPVSGRRTHRRRNPLPYGARRPGSPSRRPATCARGTAGTPRRRGRVRRRRASSPQVRLAPSSHRMGVRVLRSAIRNLYSNRCAVCSVSSHSGEAAVVHRDDPFPVAQFTAAAGDGERFVRPQGGQHDAQRDVAGRFLRIAGFPAAEDAPVNAEE